MAINIKNARIERLLDEVAELTGETKTEGIVLSARLNFGDCLTYATAVLADAPLLCAGDDFAQTDAELG